MGEIDIGETIKNNIDYWKNLYFEEREKRNDTEEKLKIAVAMLTKGTYPEKNEGDNDFNKKFIAVDKIKEIVDECIEKKANIITGKEEYCFNTNDNSFLAHKIVELVKEK